MSNKFNGVKGSDSRLRTRLWFAGTVNDNWIYRARIQNQQRFLHDAGNVGEEGTSFNRAYLDGRLGGVYVQAGRTALWAGDGNIYDDALDGIIVNYGKKIRVGAYYGKPTGANETYHVLNMDKAYGANLGFDLGKKVKLDLAYDKFETETAGADDLDIFNANLYGKFSDKFGLGVMYLRSSSDNVNYIRDGASKNGVVVTADVAGASFVKPGSWGFQAKYYHAPAGTAVAHTMEGSAITDLFNEGYKGYSLSGSYTVATNMMYTIQWFDLKGRESNVKDKVLWNEFQLRF